MTFTEGVVGQPSSFLPIRAVTDTDKTISRLLYRGLFKYDNFGTLVPDLAETWAISDEGLVYTITIRANQYWSDGSRIDANDLLYTAYKSSNLSGIATDRIDERTVRYTLPNRFSPFLSLMTLGVMKNGSAEAPHSFYAPTSGPFRVASVKKKGDLIKRVVLMGDETSNIKQIAFRFYPNIRDVITAYKMGEIHAFLSPELLEPKALAGMELYQYPIQSVYYGLFFNLRREGIKELGLRQSLAKTLDVHSIIGNYGIPVEGPISRSIYTNELYKTASYDSKVVADLSDQALDLEVVNTPALVEIAKMVKQEWEAKTGAEVSIYKHSQEDIRQKVIETRDFDILLYGQEVARDPDRYVNWHSTQANAPGLNLTGFENVRADRALEEGRKALEQEDRQRHYDEFQRIIDEQTPAIFLHHPFMNYYVSNRVKGIGTKYTFTMRDRFLDFNNWSF
ncbi:MAG: ABC transporter substrate-binding protein [bacterium]